MTTFERRQLLLGGILAGLAGLGALARPARPDRPNVSQAELEQGLPVAVGPYSRIPPRGMVLPARDELSKAIYDGYVVRGFAAPGSAPVFLLVAYGAVQDYALQLHRPEICYPASGYSIGPVAQHGLPVDGANIQCSTMTASLGPRTDRVMWWTRVGTAFPASAWQERREILSAAVHRTVPDGVLVRLSMPETPEAAATLADFAKALVAASAPRVRKVMIGSGGQRT